jgi:omega-6 fatty acid desaturase (delta-12 desaturase)
MPLRYNSTPIPASTQKAVNQIINQHKKPVFLHSLYYLARDTLLAWICYVVFARMDNHIPEWIRYTLYSLSMGTVLTGHWVLGHECGHGSFGVTKFQNDLVGYIVHSALLVPYFSWQYSHNKHHKYTNHLIHGETHVPDTKKGAKMVLNVKRWLDTTFDTEDAFAFVSVAFHLLLGWPLYLWYNFTGGRVDHGMETKLDRRGKMDHFRPSSQTMPDRLATKIALSTVGCLVTCVGLVWSGMIYQYIGPYVVVNAWLVLLTWLQHADPAVPHYGVGTDMVVSDDAIQTHYTHMVGALCTIDRPYPWLVDELHHHIGTTHVAHHLNYGVPHYEAVECTRKLKAVLGDRYLYDPTPIWRAALNVGRDCVYVDSVEGVQRYRSGAGHVAPDVAQEVADFSEKIHDRIRHRNGVNNSNSSPENNSLPTM